MTLTRKDFFRQAFLSLGKTAVECADTLQGRFDPAPEDLPEEACQPQPEPDQDNAASADNGSCLARSCGCFSCIERCEPGAITMLPGVGIRIDEARCTGCGTCEYVCPVVPKAVRLQPRRPDPGLTDTSA
jgi:ferredoxin